MHQAKKGKKGMRETKKGREKEKRGPLLTREP